MSKACSASVEALVLTGLMLLPVSGAEIAGTVRDAFSQAPLPGALVSWQATGDKTVADGEGRFSLAVPAGEGRYLTGAQKGYYTRLVVVDSPASDVVIAAEPVPPGNHAGYQLLEPMTCATCHPDQFSQWQNTPMARAGRNTWVHDTFSGQGTAGGTGGFVYQRDSSFAHENPASECAACHQPERWVAEPFSALEALSANPSPPLAHGVSCEVCHKIANVDTTRINFPGIFPGAVEFTRPADDEHQVEYGVQGDVSYEAYGMMRPSYQPQLVAEVCGVCHQDATDIAGDHSYTGPISEGTYLEWKESPYADPASPRFATCVDCHMPATETDLMCSYGLSRDPATIRSHKIEGTTPAFLKNALDLNVTAHETNGRLRVQVDVTNSRTGHHVPSGVTIRNVILLVEARRLEDQSSLTHVGEQTVHALGGVGEPAAGYYAGLPGKLYAKVIHDAANNSPTFFTDATGFDFDNRIAPLATDRTEYEFLLPPGGGTLEIRARLIYRRSFRALVDAKQWNTDGHGQPLADVTAPDFGQLMASSTQSLQVASLTLTAAPVPPGLWLQWPVFADRPVEEATAPTGPWAELQGPYEEDGWLRMLRLPGTHDERYFRFTPP